MHLVAALCSSAAALSNSIVGAENTKQRKACNQFENQANIFHQNVPSTTFLWAGPALGGVAVILSSPDSPSSNKKTLTKLNNSNRLMKLISWLFVPPASKKPPKLPTIFVNWSMIHFYRSGQRRSNPKCCNLSSVYHSIVSKHLRKATTLRVGQNLNPQSFPHRRN